MVYRIRHRTTYLYEDPANLCHNLARLRPLDLPTQQCLSFRLKVSPQPDISSSHLDGFGNHVDYFAIQHPHSELTIEAESRVEMRPQAQLLLEASCPWNEVSARIETPGDPETAMARESTLPSRMIPRLPRLTELTAKDFPQGRPLVEAVSALNERIFTEFEFKPGFTNVATPVSEVFKTRAGVCQDFAHLMIAALRNLGIPARYVSGYLETLPPPGKPKLIGADASHAWVSVFVPDHGWIEFDPTNNLRPGQRHIVVAYGSDYADVSPIRGVTMGGSDHRLRVAVDVNPEPSPRPLPR
ncbi:transglutaminase-like putative cysteine protease [Haloferula luteola]|uniref:Transglutaminase-like putative cysteine protease n=1 Tax=Haloferula luteola TaxID=595692 RepID=A0A840V4Q7_9BACT|nr:transglutaminase family protein [Haloferula luteola]MBB5352962.1 transglutaminase-like putative cysteine protease [Haloferula luteola]